MTMTMVDSPLSRMVATTPTDYWNDSCAVEELAYAIERGATGATSNPVIVGEVMKKERGHWAPRVLEIAYAPSTADWARTQAERFEASDGGQAGTLRGRPVIVMTSLGAKTGKLRKTALMRVEHDGVYAVVASIGGAPEHPVWYWNLKAEPNVELQDGSVKRDYVAREVTGEEKAVWWERAVETWPDYAKYQARTARQIPVFVLESADGP